MNRFPELLIQYQLEDDNPIRIVNVSRLDFLRWLRELDFKVGAEIGVAHAEFSKLVCEVNPQIKLYGIDAWKPYQGYSDYTRTSTFSQMKNEALSRMRPYIERNRYEIVEEFSTDAAKNFADSSLDFVYIDANHQDPFVTQDIEAWAPKVRPGGIVAGHDYVRIKRINWAVKDAIQKYTRERDLTWYVLGSDEVRPGEVREGSRTWMFQVPESI